MDTKIFYFSTTGNSLNLSREIGRGLGRAELIAIPNAIKGADTNAQRVGFIFPVHMWGLPSIVTEFVQGLKFETRPYVFAIATCGGTPAKALLELRRLLRKAGVDLDAGFVCSEGSNTVTDDPGIVRFAKRMNSKTFVSGKERLPEMLDVIRNKKKRAPETGSFAVNVYGSMMHSMTSFAKDKLKQTDRNFTVDDRCNRCRICEQVCPRKNITLEEGIVWHHNCAMCNACIQWCPQQAIHMKNETCRYRNPGIRAEDLLLR